ncbi:MAG: SIMPL domain-containing protein [Candidatus Parcubacteria bacterium]|nr:SIMPL domain-containing protein [Candidatus Parcubacteria bacterium]
MDQYPNMPAGQHCCKGKGIALVIGLLIIGAAIFASSFIVSQTFYKVKALNNSISVTGSAEKIVKSDTVKWSCDFSRTVSADMLKDGTNQMKNDLDLILRTFRQRDVKDTEIAVQTLVVSQICDSQNNVIYDQSGKQNCAGNRLSGYSLQQSILVESGDVDKIAKLSQEAASYFIDQGLIFTSQNVEYYYSKLADLKMDLISQATTNAKNRAEQIAASTSSQIGLLQSAGIGVFQVTAVNSTEISDYGYYDTAALEKKVTAVVRASFSLK